MQLSDPLDHCSYPSLYYNSTIFLLGCREQNCLQYSRQKNIKVLWNGRMMPSVLASISFLMMLNILAASAHSIDTFRELSIVTPRSFSWVVTTALVEHVNSTLCLVSFHRTIHRSASDPNGRNENRMALQMVSVILWAWQCLKPQMFHSHAFNGCLENCMVLCCCWNPDGVSQLTNMSTCMLDWHFLSLYSA